MTLCFELYTFVVITFWVEDRISLVRSIYRVTRSAKLNSVWLSVTAMRFRHNDFHRWIGTETLSLDSLEMRPHLSWNQNLRALQYARARYSRHWHWERYNFINRVTWRADDTDVLLRNRQRWLVIAGSKTESSHMDRVPSSAYLTVPIFCAWF